MAQFLGCADSAVAKMITDYEGVNVMSYDLAESAQPRNRAILTRLSFRAGARDTLGMRLLPGQIMINGQHNTRKFGGEFDLVYYDG